jgi:DNA polymerase III delta prime subunit
MAHHAFLVTGAIEEGITRALGEATRAFNVVPEGNPDVTVLRFGLFSVEDARTLSTLALRRPVSGDLNIIVVAASRIFHEAQNALLKLFEEPPETTRLFLIVPSEGNVIATLRSRLVPLQREKGSIAPIAQEFISAPPAKREKLIEKLLDRAKADNDEEKAAARAEALALAEGLTRAAYAANKQESTPALVSFLSDLDRFIPILHERSAPLKPLLEHLMLTTPNSLSR